MDYAELMMTISATNGPFLINPLDDWSDWERYITRLARCLLVYEILVGKEPYPVEPTRPTLPRPGSDAAGNERTEPTPVQLATYDLEWEVYEMEDERYQRKQAALGTIWTAIFQTVARQHLARFLEKSDFVVEIYRKLKENLEPSLEERRARVEERYRKLLLGPWV